MSGRQIGVIVLLALLSVAALVLTGLTLVLPGSDPVAPITAAVLCLGLAQLIALVARTIRTRQSQEQLRDLVKTSSALSRDVSALSARFERLRDTATAAPAMAPPASPAAAFEADRPAPRRTLELGPDMKVAARPRQRPRMGDAEAGRFGREQAREPRLDDGPAPATPPPAQADGLYLEPLVRLASNDTYGYRATLQPAPAASGRIEIFERVAPVVRVLKRKGRDVTVFCPVSARNLAEPAFIAGLTGYLGANRDIAGRIGIEISQEALAALDDQGAVGLARTAELGVVFALSQAQPDSPDLAALVALGFRYFEYDMAQLTAEHGPGLFDDDGVLARRADEAQEHGVSVIAANVAGEPEAASARRFAIFARGAHFAGPRLVRGDLAAGQDRAAAA